MNIGSSKSKLRGKNSAFEALIHASISSIFGDCPWRASIINVSDVDELDAGVLQKGFDAVVLGSRPDLGLESLHRSGLLRAMLPCVEAIVGFGGLEKGHKDLWKHTKQVVCQSPPRRVVRWAAVFHDVGKPYVFKQDADSVTFHMHEEVSIRAFRNTCRQTVLFPEREDNVRIESIIRFLGQVESYNSDWTDSAVRRLYRDADSVLNDTLDLARADVTSARQERRDAARHRVDDLEHRIRALIAADAREESLRLPKGTALIVANALGIAPGKLLGDHMKRLQRALESGAITPGKDATYYASWVKSTENSTKS